MRAANFEQIGEIRGEGDSNLNAAPPVVEVANAEPFEAGRPPQKPRPSQMNEVVLDLQVVRILEQVRIGQVARERRVVVAQSRAKQHGPRALHRHREVRKMARVPVIEALGASRAGNGVAVVVEHAEGVAVLQNKSAHVQKRRGGRYRKRLVQFGRRLFLSGARARTLIRPVVPPIVHRRPKRQQNPRLPKLVNSNVAVGDQYCRPFKAVVGRNLTQKGALKVERRHGDFPRPDACLLSPAIA